MRTRNWGNGGLAVRYQSLDDKWDQPGSLIRILPVLWIRRTQELLFTGNPYYQRRSHNRSQHSIHERPVDSDSNPDNEPGACINRISDIAVRPILYQSTLGWIGGIMKATNAEGETRPNHQRKSQHLQRYAYRPGAKDGATEYKGNSGRREDDRRKNRDTSVSHKKLLPLYIHRILSAV